ncbi:ATP-binding protein [Pandoraea pulmonicola]|uniref:histidine kinase n=1 Tax=Pandoraea pulmonicola TaxID=93221 RepID=A0AAJ5D2A8_PANPU|nr:ATP-binding protein [Pandoraea pulmonicola]AJC19529.1 two-component sensor histidine kinase [Pandoraea pulmonicola]SUA92405.1 Sensor protein qseC [Pandoraea pulmonicola]
MRSIRRRLLVGLLLTLAAALVLAGVAIFRQARTEANALFDFQLQQMALSLPAEPFSSVPGEHNDAAGLVIQIWSRNGVELYYSHPGTPLPPRAELGFTTVQTPVGDWRVYAALVGENVVQLAQPMAIRDSLAVSMALRTLLPLVVAMPLLALLVWFVVGRGLQPLRRVTKALDARAPGALDVLPEAGLPDEVRPLVRALNSLLGRLDEALAQQKAFVADAAHELRTPLAALQLQVQLLERAHTEAERAEAMHDLHDGVQRASHMVAQLLTLARQEPDAARAATTFVDMPLAPVLRDVVAHHASLAVARGIDLGLDAPEALVDIAHVRGDANALHTLFGNLVDNALKYTPRGGHVDVRLVAATPAAVVEVEDNGPGIAMAERERVFDRFFRGGAAQAAASGPTPDSPSEQDDDPQAPRTQGSGLGLAIVRNIARAHGATVELLDTRSGRGLRVRVSFGGAAQSPLPPI